MSFKFINLTQLYMYITKAPNNQTRVTHHPECGHQDAESWSPAGTSVQTDARVVLKPVQPHLHFHWHKAHTKAAAAATKYITCWKSAWHVHHFQSVWVHTRCSQESLFWRVSNIAPPHTTNTVLIKCFNSDPYLHQRTTKGKVIFCNTY